MFTWQFDVRPTIYDVIADCWFKPQSVHLQQVMSNSSSSVSSAVIIGGEHQHVPHQSVVTSSAVQPLTTLGLSVDTAGVRLAAARANPTAIGTAVNGSLDQYHRQIVSLPATTVGSRLQQQQQLLIQSGENSRSSPVPSPPLPCCVIPVVDIGPNTVISLAGHHHILQQQQHQQQSQFQYSQPVMSPGSL